MKVSGLTPGGLVSRRKPVVTTNGKKSAEANIPETVRQAGRAEPSEVKVNETTDGDKLKHRQLSIWDDQNGYHQWNEANRRTAGANTRAGEPASGL